MKYTDAELGDLVECLYQMLSSAYKSKYEDDFPLEYKLKWGDLALPAWYESSQGGLLPIHNGWWYSPDEDAPKRFKSISAYLSHLQEPPRKTHMPKSVSDLYDIIDISIDILNRSSQYRFLRYAHDIVLQEIAETEEEIIEKRKLELLFQDIPDLQKRHIKVIPIIERTIRRNRETLKLLQVKLLWLQLWLEKDKRRLSTLRKSDETRIQKGNFIYLITGEEVYRAYEAIAMSLDDSCVNDERVFRLLGLWYADSLVECGANWKDLRKLRRPKARRIIEGKLNAPYYRQWSEIVKKKYLRQQSEEEADKQGKIIAEHNWTAWYEED